MKQKETVIRHAGKVVSVSGSQLKVEILAQTACAGCHARAVCGASDGRTRVIPVRRQDDGSIAVGDDVDVIIRQGQGFKAVLIAYLIPLFILLVLLLTLPMFFENELVLAQFRDKLNSGFIFTVEKKK